MAIVPHCRSRCVQVSTACDLACVWGRPLPAQPTLHLAQGAGPKCTVRGSMESVSMIDNYFALSTLPHTCLLTGIYVAGLHA